MTIVRVATLGDIPWLLSQLRMMAIEDESNGEAYLIPNEDEKVVAVLTPFVEEHPFFISETQDGTPVGFIAGVLVPHYFNPNISVLAQTLWWVNPEHRGSSAGARLLDYFTAWGRIKGAQRINAAIGPRTPLSDRSMARKGFRLRDRTFTQEVQ